MYDGDYIERLLLFEKQMCIRDRDATYIAQLLGRMIRTPLQRHIDVDETLNEVCLFLPHFNKDNVESVMKALQDEEGSDIPADVEGEMCIRDRLFGIPYIC